MLEISAREWKQDVLEAANDKFERRLAEEVAAVRLEIAKTHASTLRWMFAGWLTTMLAIVDLATKISAR
jgi:hypothetical protein